jgi:hypothetical protein
MWLLALLTCHPAFPAATPLTRSFTGGYLEASLQLPGDDVASGFWWALAASHHK